MDNLSLLEECYQLYIQDLYQWVPEGVVDVDLALLHDLDLLTYYNDDTHNPALTRHFHVVETEEKITLINHDFVIWIVPLHLNGVTITYTLIAINDDSRPQLEMAFSTSGVYNTSKLVLRVLEKFLIEIEENEALITQLSKSGK